MHSLEKEYFKTRFPRASKYELKKLTNDWSYKEKKAEGLLSDFIKRAGNPIGKKFLGIGFGNGLNLVPFIKKGVVVYGVEVDKILLDIANNNLKDRNLDAKLSLYDGINFPFQDNYFDYAMATSVLEHVSDLNTVLKDANRVLKSGGKFYISFPNRLWPKETHTGIWFANYLPLIFVGLLFKVFKRSSIEDWSLHFLSFWKIKKILRKQNIPFKIIFETESKNWFKKMIKEFLALIGIHHSAILRTVMIILEKK